MLKKLLQGGGKRHGFVRAVGVLAGGTAFAQALTILALPLLTRLYSPEDFSLLAVYVAILGILTVVGCLRFEIAIPLPEHDEEAAHLLVLALGSAFAISVVLLSAAMLLPAQIAGWLDAPGLEPFLWMIPFGVWFTATYSALQYWASRKKRFTAIARTRVGQVLGSVSTQAGLGALGVTPFGLLMGNLLSGGLGALGLARTAWRADRAAFQSIHRAGLRSAFKKYDRFPKFSTWEALSNSAGIQLPMLLIAALGVDSEAGYLLLATRVMSAPVGLVGAAVAQVYLSHAAQAQRDHVLAETTSRVICGLIKAGVGPLILIGATAPLLFPWFFGEAWLRSGELVAWMTPWFIMQFISSPVSMVLHVSERHKTALGLQMFGLLLRSGAVLIAAYAQPQWMAQAYAVSGFVFYLIYFLVVVRVSGAGSHLIDGGFWRAVAVAIAWSILVTLALVLVNSVLPID